MNCLTYLYTWFSSLFFGCLLFDCLFLWRWFCNIYFCKRRERRSSLQRRSAGYLCRQYSWHSVTLTPGVWVSLTPSGSLRHQLGVPELGSDTRWRSRRPHRLSPRKTPQLQIPVTSNRPPGCPQLLSSMAAKWGPTAASLHSVLC